METTISHENLNYFYQKIGNNLPCELRNYVEELLKQRSGMININKEQLERILNVVESVYFGDCEFKELVLNDVKNFNK